MTTSNSHWRLTPRRLLLAAGAGTALAAFIWWLPPARIAVWHWRVQLMTAGDADAARLVERIAEQGEYGIDALAVLVGSPRSSVVEAAREAIRRELESWPRLDAATRERRALRSAQALAGQVDWLNPPARRIASAYAVRILREENSATGDQRQQIVAACEKVLRAAVLERRQMLLARRERIRADDESSEPRRYDPDDDAFVRRHFKSLPGGGLPVGEVPADAPLLGPEGEDSAAGDPEPRAEAAEPAKLGAEAAANAGARGTRAHGRRRPALAPRRSRARRPRPLARRRTERHAPLDARAAFQRSGAPARAEDELRQQGFEALQLELARQLTHPDPRVRRELAESLPAMPGIDAHVWLVWLSRDEIADVRLAALTVMATTSDPNVLRRIEQMARSDADPRVQRQGERLLGLREAGHRPSGGRRSAQ